MQTTDREEEEEEEEDDDDDDDDDDDVRTITWIREIKIRNYKIWLS